MAVTMAPTLATLPFELKEQIFELLWAPQTSPAVHLYPDKCQPSFTAFFKLGLVNKALFQDSNSFLDEKISRHGLELFCWRGAGPLRKSPVASYVERRKWAASAKEAYPWQKPRAPVGENLHPEFRPRRRRGAMDAGDARRVPPPYMERVTQIHLDITDIAYGVEPLDLSLKLFPQLDSITIYWREKTVCVEVFSPFPDTSPHEILNHWFCQGLYSKHYDWLYQLLLARPDDLRVYFKQNYVYYRGRPILEFDRREELTLEVKGPRILSRVELTGRRIIADNTSDAIATGA
jgi:hypothetical protein